MFLSFAALHAALLVEVAYVGACGWLRAVLSMSSCFSDAPILDTTWTFRRSSYAGIILATASLKPFTKAL